MQWKPNNEVQFQPNTVAYALFYVRQPISLFQREIKKGVNDILAPSEDFLHDGIRRLE